MACPEKDTTDPEKETRKGGKGCKTPTKNRSRIGSSLLHLPEAGAHSTRRTHRTVFDAARIVDMSDGSNERNQSRTKHGAYSVGRYSNSTP